MKRLVLGLIATVATLSTVAALAAGGGTWVSKDGDTIDLPGNANVFLFDEGEPNEFDLSELADGETRVFGSGVKQVTAIRQGDQVILNRPAHDGERELKITCHVDRDSCRILTFDDDPEKVMIVLQKTRTCVNGEGDCESVDISIGDFDGDLHSGMKKIMIRAMAHCDDDGECSEVESVISGHGGPVGEGREMIIEIDSGTIHGGDHDVMVFHGLDAASPDTKRIALRCPEGDASIRISPEEAEETFLCPKHSVPMEKSGELMRRRFHHSKEVGDGDH